MHKKLLSVSSELEAHRLIGKLEINASGNDERLTVWLDPTGVEASDEEVAVAEADVVGGLNDFTGNLRLDQVASPEPLAPQIGVSYIPMVMMSKAPPLVEMSVVTR